MLTVSDISAALPPHLKSHATQDLTDLVNAAATDPETCATIRENFITYTAVLREGRFKTEDYLNAVTYVTYKIMGYTNMESYARTFPNRYGALRARGASDKEISSYVAAYNKNQLVNLIMERTLVPAWVLNQDAFQAAINKQVDLMTNAKSEKVQMEAANSLLTHLKKPEKHQVDLNVGIAETSGMKELNSMLGELAQRQKELITQGTPTREIAHQKLKVVEDLSENGTPEYKKDSEIEKAILIEHSQEIKSPDQ